MNVEQITNKLDALFEENRGDEAEQLLETSMEQAVKEQDDAALLMLLNEMIGYMRETSQVERSYRYADAARKLMDRMGICGNTAYATTLLNIANAYRAGGRLQDSLAVYEEVLGLYEKLVDKQDMLYAGLYNNISLLYQEMGDFKKAKENLLSALSIVKSNQDTCFEEGVTYANLAATCLQLNEDEAAADYFKQAIAIFEAHGIQDAHYCAALASMGTYYFKKEAYKEAADCFEKAMAGMKASLGENAYYERLAENLAACRKAMQVSQSTAAEASVRKAPTAGKTASMVMPEKGNTQTGISGLALCKDYYEAYGKPMLQEQFAAYVDRIAVGLCGEGSDCFGFDDAISRDHDWGPGFCMWVTDEVYAEVGEQLKAAYDNLPKEFKGFVRRGTLQGKNRVSVCTVQEFYDRILGKGNWEQEIRWSEIADEAFAAAVNGEVFADGEGIFSAVRTKLQKGFPEKILFLKLAESCAKFSQSAQYNYSRMAGRGDAVAAELSLMEGIRHAMKLLYFMEQTYPPHDKWLYQGLVTREASMKETQLIAGIIEEREFSARCELVERLAELLSDRLYEEDYISARTDYLETCVQELLYKASYGDKTDAELVELIAKTEFAAFDKVQNEGGRASCQNDWYTFSIMRKSQYMTWNRRMLLQYLYDFTTEYQKGRNLITEKYGRMMESTAPAEYAKLAAHFPMLSPEKKQIIEAIVQIQIGFMEEFAKDYPHLAGNARTIHTWEDGYGDTSYETYLRGEISTYSDKMLELYGRFVAALCKAGKNLAVLTMENSVHLYGYKSLEDAENII